jgi:hypothetical protein
VNALPKNKKCQIVGTGRARIFPHLITLRWHSFNSNKIIHQLLYVIYLRLDTTWGPVGDDLQWITVTLWIKGTFTNCVHFILLLHHVNICVDGLRLLSFCSLWNSVKSHVNINKHLNTVRNPRLHCPSENFTVAFIAINTTFVWIHCSLTILLLLLSLLLVVGRYWVPRYLFKSLGIY